MRTLVLVPLLVLAGRADAQPMTPGTDLSAYAAAAGVLADRGGGAVPVATPPAQGASDDLYWAGVAFDVVGAGAGAALLVTSAVALSDDNPDGFGSLVGAMTAMSGAVVLAAFGADLVYVALGGDPVLARTFRR